MRERPCCARAVVVEFDVLVDPKEPRRFVLYEIYDDDEAFDLHLRSEHYLSFAETIREGIEARSIRKLGYFASPTATESAGQASGCSET